MTARRMKPVVIDLTFSIRISNMNNNKKEKFPQTPLVFTNGCFDIIHAGHIKLLRQASQYGNVVVGINTDRSVGMLKKGRPINNLHARMTVLSSIRYVWHVIEFDEETPERLIRSLNPDVLVKGSDWKEEDIVGADYVKANGGKVVRVDLLPGCSTTEILQKVNTPIKGEN